MLGGEKRIYEDLSEPDYSHFYYVYSMQPVG